MLPIQRRSGGGETAGKAAPAPAGGGAAIPEAVRAKMEGSFGADFSAVRIHQGDTAPSLGALAYTSGNDIHFAPGQYDPHGSRGQELLGHELTHVVQQRQGRVAVTGQAKGVDLNDDPGLEQEADHMGAMAARGERTGMSAAAGAPAAPVVQGYFELNREQAEKLAKLGEGAEFIEQIRAPKKDEGLKDDVKEEEPQKENFLFTEKDQQQKPVTKLRFEKYNQMQALLVSDDGLLAIQATNEKENAKTFFAEEELIGRSNGTLEKVKSTFRLHDTGKTLTVPDLLGTEHVLKQVLAEKPGQKVQSGTDVTGQSQCVLMEGQVTGGHGPMKLGEVNNVPNPSILDPGNSLAGYATGYANAEEHEDPEQKGLESTQKAEELPRDLLEWPVLRMTLKPGKSRQELEVAAGPHVRPNGRALFQIRAIEESVKGSYTVRSGEEQTSSECETLLKNKLTQWSPGLFSWFKTVDRYKTIEDLQNKAKELVINVDEMDETWVMEQLKALNSDYEIGNWEDTKKEVENQLEISPMGGVPEDDLQPVGQEQDGVLRKCITVEQAMKIVNERLGGFVEALEDTGQTGRGPASFYRGTQFQEDYLQALGKLKGDKTVAQKLGLNEHASPDVGGAFMTAPVGGVKNGLIFDSETQTFRKPPAQYHWAGVVAKSGEDTITFENYSRGNSEDMGGEDPRNYFAMYGPLREVTVDENKLTPKESEDKNLWKKGTFHGKWKGEYPNAVTGAYKAKEKEDK